MQSLAKLLVIEDDAAIRLNLSVILEFVGEQCEVIESTQIDQINWSAVWVGAF
ncbi:flagellar regulatory protein A [Vibrio cholerae]|nr:flagellar regulatory protein A [Vibrio cholerae]